MHQPQPAQHRRTRDVLASARPALRIRERPLLEGPAQVDVAARDRRGRRALLLADVAAVLVALVAVALLSGRAPSPWLLVLPPVVVLTLKTLGLYDRDELVVHKTTLDEAPKLFQAATLLALLLALTPVSWVGGDLHREKLLALWGTSFALLLVMRAAARANTTRRMRAERCLVVGDGDGAHLLARELRPRGGDAAEVVGVVPLDADVQRAVAAVTRAIRTDHVHRVIIAPRAADADHVLDVIRAVKVLGVKVSVLPRMLEVVGSSVVFDDVGGFKLLGVQRFGLSRSSRLLKRSFDIAGASLLLLACAPVMLLLAALIKRDSPGPVLFRQTRVGRDGERFEMFKFRSMVDGADAQKAQLRAQGGQDGLFKLVEDPRVTRVGRLLRKTSLDELPQLLNVLRGDMSLVGPRPLVEDEDEQITGLARRRLHLTPGMTGHWQLLVSARVPLHEMVKIDYLYVAGWSLWGDVKVLLRTVPYVLRRRGV
jgi:exopolysaccharide biosynthesis polyprenyl glycosylphosphotransferase